MLEPRILHLLHHLRHHWHHRINLLLLYRLLLRRKVRSLHFGRKLALRLLRRHGRSLHLRTAQVQCFDLRVGGLHADFLRKHGTSCHWGRRVTYSFFWGCGSDIKVKVQEQSEEPSNEVIEASEEPSSEVSTEPGNEPGINIKAKLTILGEGCRGHLGKQVINESNSKRIDFTSVPNGIYNLVILHKDIRITKRVIKQ